MLIRIFHFHNLGLIRGEGLCNLNYVELYSGLLSCLKHDLIGGDVSAIQFDMHGICLSNEVFSINCYRSQCCERMEENACDHKCHSSVCRIGDVQLDGSLRCGPIHSFPNLLEPVAG